MLILTRKTEQGIVIDGHVVVRVLAIDGDRVKIGIDAPRSVSVLREELLHEIADENQAAARFHGHQGLSAAFRGLDRTDRGDERED
ncbi:MAG: carbon storage regulator CsrA [Dehalococcoidia bacterium]